MSTITTLNESDNWSTSRSTINTNFSNLNTGKQEVLLEWSFVDWDKTKLDGISTWATANDTDANLKNRSNHTGSQSISTITGLQSSLDAKAGLSWDQNFDSGTLFIDSSNNRVGIGETSPWNTLHINWSSEEQLSISWPVNSAGETAGVSFRYGWSWDSNKIARILWYTQNGGGGDLLFQTASNWDAAWNTKMAIMKSGNVWIWTTSPSWKLTVNTDANENFLVDTSTWGYETAISWNTGDGAYITMKDNYTDNIVLRAWGNSYFNGGNVGIWTSSPSNKLHLYSDWGVIWLDWPTHTYIEWKKAWSRKAYMGFAWSWHSNVTFTNEETNWGFILNTNWSGVFDVNWKCDFSHSWTGDSFFFTSSWSSGRWMVMYDGASGSSTWEFVRIDVANSSSSRNVLVIANNGTWDTLNANGNLLVKSSGSIIQSSSPSDGEYFQEWQYSWSTKFGFMYEASVTANTLFRLWNSYLWVDGTWDLRIKSSTPTSDTDGTVVWSQS